MTATYLPPGLWPADRPVVIVGAGGHAREVLGICYDLGCEQRVLGFVDDSPATHGAVLDGKPVLGDLTWLREAPAGTHIVIAVGSTPARRAVAARACAFGVAPATVISPHAVVSRFARIGRGSMICAGSIVNTNATVGEHVIVNVACNVSHDATLEDYVTLAPGVHVSGHVTIREGADVGTGAAINQGIEIGAWSIIGSNSAVVRDIPPNVTAVGVPARVIKERPAGWHLPGGGG